MTWRFCSNTEKERMTWGREFILMRKSERRPSIIWKIVMLLWKSPLIRWFPRPRKRTSIRVFRFIIPAIGEGYQIDLLFSFCLFFLYYFSLSLDLLCFLFLHVWFTSLFEKVLVYVSLLFFIYIFRVWQLVHNYTPFCSKKIKKLDRLLMFLLCIWCPW